MKGLKPCEAFFWEQYDINVVPFLTFKEMELIVENILMHNSYLKREEIMVSNVLVCCTDIWSDKTENEDGIAYEDIVYSGMWDELLELCPYIKQGIELIQKEVERRESLSLAMAQMIDGLLPDITKTIETFKMADIDPKLKENILQFLTEHKTGETNASS